MVLCTHYTYINTRCTSAEFCPAPCASLYAADRTVALLPHSPSTHPCDSLARHPCPRCIDILTHRLTTCCSSTQYYFGMLSLCCVHCCCVCVCLALSLSFSVSFQHVLTYTCSLEGYSCGKPSLSERARSALVADSSTPAACLRYVFSPLAQRARLALSRLYWSVCAATVGCMCHRWHGKGGEVAGRG